MPHLIVTPFAVDDIQRCRRFLSDKSPAAVRHALKSIRDGLNMLKDMPEAGRPSRLPGYRELIIDYGDSGYIARYIYRPQTETIYVVAIWHQREAGY